MFEYSKIHILMNQIDSMYDEEENDIDAFRDLIDRLILEIDSTTTNMKYKVILMYAMLKFKKYPLIRSKEWTTMAREREYARFLMSTKGPEMLEIAGIAKKFINIKDDVEAMAFKLTFA